MDCIIKALLVWKQTTFVIKRNSIHPATWTVSEPNKILGRNSIWHSLTHWIKLTHRHYDLVQSIVFKWTYCSPKFIAIRSTYKIIILETKNYKYFFKNKIFILTTVWKLPWLPSWVKNGKERSKINITHNIFLFVSQGWNFFICIKWHDVEMW